MSEDQVRGSVDHLFRHHAGQMSAVLTRIFGFEKIDLVEDAIQESMIRALKNWTIRGVPENPAAWLIQVAKNRIIDELRKGSKSDTLGEGEDHLKDLAAAAQQLDSVSFSNEIREDQLRMIFACCHPSLTPDSRIALTLKTVGGFSVNEIASAFLSKKEAVAKMLTRAKRTLAESDVEISIPAPKQIPERLDAVLKVIYLMFNEGYSASAGDAPVRRDLCSEAIRLTRLLSQHPVTGLPKVHALAALLLFQASRLRARVADDGSLVLLAHQDRALWDSGMIAEGLRHLRLSASGDEISVYHLEAEAASFHAVAPRFEETDWKGLLSTYDRLLARRHSPIAALNRLVALAEVSGAGAAIDAAEELRDEKLEAYYPFHVTLGELRLRAGNTEEALRSYEFAVGLTDNLAVKRFIEGRIAELREWHAERQ